MQYEKRLVILTGSSDERGTLKIERNAFGLWATLSVYGLLKDRYFLAVTLNSQRTDYNLGSLQDKIKVRLNDDTDIKNVHYTVYREDGDAVLYGTLAQTKLWWGNLPNGWRSKNAKKNMEKLIVESKAQTFNYSTLELLPDIFPSNDGYDDNAVSTINYYSKTGIDKSFEQDSVDISKESTDFQSNAEKENVAQDDKVMNEIKENVQNKIGEGESVFDDNNDNNKDDINIDAIKTEKEHENLSLDNLELAGTQNYNEDANKWDYDKKENEQIYTRRKFGAFAVRGRRATFYERVHSEVEAVFRNGERMFDLEEKMPFTKWVKIRYDEKRHYIVGLVGETPDYICYGLFGVESNRPPEALGKNCVFIPYHPKGTGYWLLYQSTVDGRTVMPLNIH